MILGAWSISNGILHGRKKRVHAIRFFTVKNRENLNGIYFSNCSGYIGIRIDDESEKQFFVQS